MKLSGATIAVMMRRETNSNVVFRFLEAGMKLIQFLGVLAVTASIAACGSHAATNQRSTPSSEVGIGGPGAGSPSVNASNPTASTINIPGPNGASCGAYTGKPSVEQVTDSVRDSAGKLWDSQPSLQRQSREQYVESYLQGFMTEGATSSPSDILNAAPADGVLHFGRYLCDTVFQSTDDMRGMEIQRASPDAAINLWQGLTVCQKLEFWSPTDDANVMFVKNIDKMLCPQIPVR